MVFVKTFDKPKRLSTWFKKKTQSFSKWGRFDKNWSLGDNVVKVGGEIKLGAINVDLKIELLDSLTKWEEIKGWRKSEGRTLMNPDHDEDQRGFLLDSSTREIW